MTADAGVDRPLADNRPVTRSLVHASNTLHSPDQFADHRSFTSSLRIIGFLGAFTLN
jgi:hypothetical protein